MNIDDWAEIEKHLFEVPREFYGRSINSLRMRHEQLENSKWSGWYNASLHSEVTFAEKEIMELERAISRLRQDLGKLLNGPSKVSMAELRLRHIPDSLRKKYSIGPEASAFWDSTESVIPQELEDLMDKYLGMSVMLKE